MKIDPKKLIAVLIEGNYITEKDVKGIQKQLKTKRTTIEEHLISENLITKDLLGQALAEMYGLPYADLNSNPPIRKQVLKIPEKIAKQARSILFELKKDEVVIATDDPEKSTKYIKEIKELFKPRKVTLHYSLTEDVDATFIHYRKELETRFGEIIRKSGRVAPDIIEEIFEDALVLQASDIHFEPQQKEVVIRFRIDGVMYETARFDKKYYENILNRIKVMASLRLDDHFSAQDGAIRYIKDGKAIDLRVSVAPIIDGEKIVIRVLSKYVRDFTLSDLGLSSQDQDTISEVSKKPFGMILVTGPTGSGKTTTLYALLKKLNKPEVNITTIEDPVEYKLMGVNQIQVNTQTNLTFAKGLRSIVRQDPDIILVGEIRDNETAEIAVNAALTGHLLLSTFHANDAATAIPRLLDMGVEPFLLASTLEVIVAQRLVRRICDICRTSYTVKREDLKKDFPQAEKYFEGSEITMYKGKGCKACNNKGYKGRVGIFEFITITKEMKNLILENPSTAKIWELARKQGASSLFEDGIEKVENGLTTLEELLRVAPPPEEVTKSRNNHNGRPKEQNKT